jgi:hypothetical protein
MDGFYVKSTGICTLCPFSNCILCSSAYCQECSIGYYLASNGLNCTKIVCKTGFLFDGYECICPIGTYFTIDKC